MPETFINATKAVLTDAFATGVQANTDLYTVPGSTTAIIHSLYIANIDTLAAATVDISIDNGTIFHLAKELPVPAGSTLSFDKPINLATGERLKVRGSVAGDLEAFASILELTA